MADLKQAFDFRSDAAIRRQHADDEETKNVDFMTSRGKLRSPNQDGVRAGLKTTKKFITDSQVAPRSKMADATKPKESRSKAVLGGKSSEPETKAERKLNRVSLERTANGHIKATHRYNDGEEIHAVPPNDFLTHLGSAFNLSNEKKGIDAKRSNIESYEKEHGSLTKPKAAAPAAVEPSNYDKIRENLRAKSKAPAAPVDDLLSRADALINKK